MEFVMQFLDVSLDRIRASAVPGAGAGSVVAGDAEACVRISSAEPDWTVDAEPAKTPAAMAKGP